MFQSSSALFLTQESPVPPRGSDKFRDFHLLKLLCERVEHVEVLCLSRNAVDSTEDFQLPKNLVVSEIRKSDPGFFHRLFNPRPLTVYADSVEEALQDRANPGKLLWISRLLMANCVPLAKSLGYQVILDEHNVESALLKQSANHPLKKIPTLLAAVQTRHYESRFCLESNAVVAASNIDASRLSKLAPGAAVHVIPNAVDHTWFEPARSAQGSTLFFSGSLNHPVNIQGLQWFAAEVMPRLRAHLGSRIPRIVVAGANPAREFQAHLKSHGFEVIANPESMLPYFAEAALVFVPIRSGGGTPLKILEAMAAGRAVVTTGKATEGLVLAPTYDILIADSADGFTSAILRLLENPQLRKDLGAHASQTVLTRYDWRCARSAMDELLRSVQQAGTHASWI